MCTHLTKTLVSSGNLTGVGRQYSISALLGSLGHTADECADLVLMLVGTSLEQRGPVPGAPFLARLLREKWGIFAGPHGEAAPPATAFFFPQPPTRFL